MKTVLVTGASGFVGRYLRVALRAAGHRLRLASRRPDKQPPAEADAEWVAFDLDRPETIGPALAGCDAAYFMVHSVGDSDDYPERERAAALAFRAAAERTGVTRVIYLGGVAPPQEPSRHLASRIETGEILRAGDAPTVELRAAMIVGHGSASWQMVHDLGNRLPAMILPRWLKNHSWPIAIDDVIFALVAALELPLSGSVCFDIPGPERVSHREMLARVARALGKRPVMAGVPLLSPKLSSYWIGLVTSVNLSMATELVYGLVADLDPSQPSLWDNAVAHPLCDLDTAIARALEDRTTGGAYPSEAACKRLRAAHVR